MEVSMRRGIKVLSVLMLVCLVFTLTACGNSKIVGNWVQTVNQPGNVNQLQNDFGEIQFNSDGTYKRAGSTKHLGFGGVYAESGTYDYNIQKSVLILTPELQNGVVMDGTTKLTYMCYVDGNILKLAMGDAGDIDSQVILERRS
jgi:hypothetical protein